MASFSPPEPFTITKPSAWPEWIARFSRYRQISKLTEESEAHQISCLLYAMGPESETVVRTLNLAESDLKQYDVVKNALDEYFAPVTHVIYERACFYRRNQKKGETADEYVRVLYDMAEKCRFENKSTQIRDKIVVGIRDEVLSKQMQMMDNDKLTEQKAVQMVRQSETITQHMDDLKLEGQGQGAEGQAPSKKANKKKKKAENRDTPAPAEDGDDPPPVQQNPGGGRQRQKKQPVESTPVQNPPCGQCCLFHGHGNCPAKNATCHKCKKVGHYANACHCKFPKKSAVNISITQ